MPGSNADLLAILRVGHDTSMRGAGLSLREALRRTRYADRRPTLGPADLYSLLLEHPELSETWLAYSEDKRTSGGWYLLRSRELGQFGRPETHKHFDSLEKAVAEYVVRELDFWAGIGGTA